jgi:hypothetical protein
MTIEPISVSNRQASECLKASGWSQAWIAQGFVPDSPSLFPGVSTNLYGGKSKGMVGDPRINMYSPIIIGRLDIILHSCWLRIFPQHRIIIRCARRLHRAQCDSMHLRRKQSLTNQPDQQSVVARTASRERRIHPRWTRSVLLAGSSRRVLPHLQ